ncbi:S1 family peptidase [Aeromonas bestiarum]|uniref:S1 family peptidase n=1 Tax=Aeromonas bestiarum TaxID=105751 RepID=UPI003D1E9372
METTNKFQAVISHPETYTLDRKCEWVRPAFEPYDGFVEQNLWELGGLIVAIGFMNADSQHTIGSGVMVAPGICLTATHVIEETRNKNALLYSFPCSDSIRIWCPEDFHAHKSQVEALPFQKPEERYLDVSILSYSPFSKFNDSKDYVYSPVEVSLPKIGERLWAAGYREISNDGIPKIGFFVTSGIVTEQYPDGRGGHMKGACIEVAMKALGGMSGGPVFNEAGRIVGVISSCLEGQEDDKGPTYVTLVWPSLVSTVYAPWPEQHWPESIAGLQVKAKEKGARLLGSAEFSEAGELWVKFPKQPTEEIHSIFCSANHPLAIENEGLYDYIYDIFEDILETEGLNYLGSLTQSDFEKLLDDSERTEIIKLFRSIEADTIEGLEDIEVKSATLLESGCIGIDFMFDIRGVFLTLEMDKPLYEYQKALWNLPLSFHNFEDHGETITYQHFVRPNFRVTLTYDPSKDEYRDLKYHTIWLKV